MHSEIDIEEEDKHKSASFSSMKAGSQTEEINMSNVIKLPGNTGNVSLPPALAMPSTGQAPNANNTNIEEIQRQRILQIVSQNTFMLNNVLAQQEVNKQRLRHCMENLKVFR